MFFEQVWVHFGIPRSIISDKDTKFISTFWTILREKMDMKLKRYATFHPHIYVQIKLLDRTLVQHFRVYNQKHPKT